MTKATKANINLNFNSKPKVKEKMNILEEVDIEKTVEVESDDIIFDIPAEKGMWTDTGYQGGSKVNQDKLAVKGVVISHEEKKKQKTLFSGFEVKQKKTITPAQPTSTTIVNSSQTNKIINSGGIGSEDIFSGKKSKITTTKTKTLVKQAIIDEEEKKKKEKDKRERALASNLFSGMSLGSKAKTKKEMIRKAV